MSIVRKLTIVFSDGLIWIDGELVNKVGDSGDILEEGSGEPIPDSRVLALAHIYHAVQFEGGRGMVEYATTPLGVKPANKAIDSCDEFMPLLKPYYDEIQEFLRETQS